MLTSFSFDKKYFSILYLVFILDIVVCQTLPNNSCPHIFSYQYDRDRYIGVIQINEPADNQVVRLAITMSIGGNLRSEYFGELIMKSRNEGILVYNVLFPTGLIPQITQILVNNQEICRAPVSQTTFVATIKLEHTLDLRQNYNRNTEKDVGNPESIFPSDILNRFFYPENFPNWKLTLQQEPAEQAPDYQPTTAQPIIEHTVRPSIRPSVRPSVWPSVRPSGQPSVRRTVQIVPDQHAEVVNQSQINAQYPVQAAQDQQPLELSNRNSFQPETTTNRNKNPQKPIQCGVLAPRFLSTPLMLRGIEIQRGSWPWIAAIYLYNTDTLRFHCAGSLISHRAVITAAHCFAEENGSQVHPNNCLVKLGRHNRNHIHETGMEEVAVSRIISHEDYRPDASNGYDADIAIVLLQTPVEYTDYIRPICIPVPRDRNSVGMKGTVVGWGKNEYNRPSPIPMKTEAPIVPESECIRSNRDYDSLISNRTFCAGYRNGSGPCDGDSGGGLGINRDGRWMIYGIVSASLVSPDGNCDLTNYIIYTDVSVFVDWIRQYV